MSQFARLATIGGVALFAGTVGYSYIYSYRHPPTNYVTQAKLDPANQFAAGKIGAVSQMSDFNQHKNLKDELTNSSTKPAENQLETLQTKISDKASQVKAKVSEKAGEIQKQIAQKTEDLKDVEEKVKKEALKKKDQIQEQISKGKAQM